MKPYRKFFGIWVPDKRFTDNRGFISPGVVGAVAGARRRSGGFLPSDVAGLKLWLKGDGSAYNTGTTQATDNQTVETWVDYSGNSNNATQSDSAKRPTLQTNELNSLPVLRFDGGDVFDITSIAITSASYFVVLKQTLTFTYQGIIGSDSTGDFTLRIENSGPIHTEKSGVAAIATGSTSIADSWYHIGATYSSPDGKLYVNGSLDGSGSSAQTFSGITRIGLQLSFYYTGDIAEVLVYDVAVSDTDRGKIEGYLESKYAL